jgi:AGCS family alanine or glycine:cation symporter
MTGLVVVSSGAWQEGLTGAKLTQASFADVPFFASIVLPISLFFFVYTTLVGWSYYGEKSIEYLCGERAIVPYRVLWVVLVYVGSVLELKIVWDFADIANALMAIPNVISLLVLAPVIVAETREHLWDTPFGSPPR